MHAYGIMSQALRIPTKTSEPEELAEEFTRAAAGAIQQISDGLRTPPPNVKPPVEIVSHQFFNWVK